MGKFNVRLYLKNKLKAKGLEAWVKNEAPSLITSIANEKSLQNNDMKKENIFCTAIQCLCSKQSVTAKVKSLKNLSLQRKIVIVI
jgi:hypothetical protein